MKKQTTNNELNFKDYKEFKMLFYICMIPILLMLIIIGVTFFLVIQKEKLAMDNLEKQIQELNTKTNTLWFYESVIPCKTDNLQETANCIKDKVKTIYNYHSTADTFKTNDEIIANGGDCLDYASLYESLAVMLGYNASVIVRHQEGHAITIMTDGKTVCELNLDLDPECSPTGSNFQFFNNQDLLPPIQYMEYNNKLYQVSYYVDNTTIGEKQYK